MISVIICTRNRPELFNRAVDSVFNQTYKDFEVIIIDDNSDKYYGDIPNVRYFRNEQRKGLAWNKNFGVLQARGEYIVFLDDDNELHQEFLQYTVKILQSDWRPIVGVPKEIIYPEGKVIQQIKTPCAINDGFLIRREVFEKIKFDETLQGNEDADFGFQCEKQGFKMAIIVSEVALMKVYSSPIINTSSYSDYTDYHLTGMLKFWLKNKDELSKEDYKYYQTMIGRMFLLGADHKWFKWLYIIEQKLRRYKKIYGRR